MFIIQSLLFLLLFFSLEKRNIHTIKSHPRAEPVWAALLCPSEPQRAPAFPTTQKAIKAPKSPNAEEVLTPKHP